MRNKVIGFALSALLFALCTSAEAQQAKKVYRIGYLSIGGSFQDSPGLELFRQDLRAFGYIEGQNLVIEWRFAKGNADRLPELAAELVRPNPDVIVTSATQPVRALKDATTIIPIVVIGAGDLVGRGLVASLARPGGNITGSTSIAPELTGKRLELLKEVVPRASRMAFLYQPYERDELREMQIAARALGVQIQQLEVQDASEFQNAYAAMTKERIDALTISRSTLTNFHRKQLIDLAVKHRLPAMCDGTEWANDGCLISYSRDRTESIRRAAVYVDKILKGANPGDLPVQQPKKFELIINVKTAKQIGLTIPPNVLARADRVIR
jgi:putative tryptophan/tyrosine transport system substrate-binding protein